MPRLKVGDKMPNFMFNTAYEQDKLLHAVLNNKTTFFVILRYIGCTVCRYDVHLLQKRYDEFVRKGAQVFVVMQSSPENVREDLKDLKLPFDIICDTELTIYNGLEIVPAKDKSELVTPEIKDVFNEKKEAAKAAGFSHGKYEGIEEQLPATFLVDGDGTVKLAYYGKNIMDKPSIDEMLMML